MARTRSRTALRRGRLAVLLVAGLVVGLGSSAAAHSVLLSSDPRDGDVLPVAPQRVELVFDAEVITLGTRLQVTGPGGAVATAPPEVTGARVVAALPAGLPAGEYEVLWRVTSADGHPISDELGFTVTGDPAGSPTEPPRTAPAPEAVTPSGGAVSAAPTTAASAGAGTQSATGETGDTGATEPTAATSPGWPWGWLAGIALAVALAAAALALFRRRGSRP